MQLSDVIFVSRWLLQGRKIQFLIRVMHFVKPIIAVFIYREVLLAFAHSVPSKNCQALCNSARISAHSLHVDRYVFYVRIERKIEIELS